MKITNPNKIIQLVHKKTSERLELRVGEEVVIHSLQEPFNGIISNISRYNGHPYIELNLSDGTTLEFFYANIESIGSITLSDYNVTAESFLGDYEVELDKSSHPIALYKGDTIAVYCTDNKNSYKVIGALQEIEERVIVLKVYSTIKRQMAVTVIPINYVQDIKTLKEL